MGNVKSPPLSRDRKGQNDLFKVILTLLLQERKAALKALGFRFPIGDRPFAVLLKIVLSFSSSFHGRPFIFETFIFSTVTCLIKSSMTEGLEFGPNTRSSGQL